MKKAVRKNMQRTEKEQRQQANIISCVAFTVLWEDGWREKRIMRRFASAMEVMQELKTKNLTPLEILEEETGIELQMDGERSYHEFMYLAHDVPMRPMTDAEIIYMRNRSVKFASLILLSSLCVVLHREDGWGFERISKFLYRMDLVRKLLGDDEQKCMDFMRNNTGKDPKEMWM